MTINTMCRYAKKNQKRLITPWEAGNTPVSKFSATSGLELLRNETPTVHNCRNCTFLGKFDELHNFWGLKLSLWFPPMLPVLVENLHSLYMVY